MYDLSINILYMPKASPYIVGMLLVYYCFTTFLPPRM